MSVFNLEIVRTTPAFGETELACRHRIATLLTRLAQQLATGADLDGKITCEGSGEHQEIGTYSLDPAGGSK